MKPGAIQFSGDFGGSGKIIVYDCVMIILIIKTSYKLYYNGVFNLYEVSYVHFPQYSR
jgi:hypothetical protein